MKRAFVLLALVALAIPASRAQSLTADSVTGVFQAWAEEMNEQLATEPSGRHLLQDASNVNALLGPLETAATSMQSFFRNTLGSTWSTIVPAAWGNTSYTWNNLQAALENVTSLPTMFDEYESISGHLCTPEQYVPGVKTSPGCSGPTVTLQYVPKVCVFSKDLSDMVCAPANITLVRTPGSCVHDLQPASHYLGKECNVKFTLGKPKTHVKGGSEYPIALKPIKEVLATVKGVVEEKLGDKFDKIESAKAAASAAVLAGVSALKAAKSFKG